MNQPPPQLPAADWRPLSDQLVFADGLWRASTTSPIAYPAAGNEFCFQVEDGSYWFRHRIACIQEVMRRLPPAGAFYDIGGGNGYVALALQSAGAEVVLVEPGPGAHNALRRGVRHVVQSTLADAGFRPHSLPAAGAFDVVEHIADDVAFLRDIRRQLVPGGRFYCTVPAGRVLWSEDDVQAGHFRRYSPQTLALALRDAGFTVEFMSPFFLWLTAPVALLRTLPSRLHLKKRAAVGTSAAIHSDHHLPALLAGIVHRAQAWELGRLQAGRPLPFGSSLLCVARVNGP